MKRNGRWTWALLGLLSAINAAAIAADDPKDPAIAAKNKAIVAKLAEPIPLKFKDAPLEDVLKFIKKASQGAKDNGIPIYVDPIGLQEAEKTMKSPVSIDAKAEPLKLSLQRLLKSVGLAYTVKDGLLTITSERSLDEKPAVKAAPKKKGDARD
jgi:hypothetical protein